MDLEDDFEVGLEEYDYNFPLKMSYPPLPAFKETFESVNENCVIPSVLSVMGVVSDLVLYNVAFLIFSRTEIFPKIFFHVFSFTLGIMLLSTVNSPVKLGMILGFLIPSYVILRAAHRVRGNAVFEPDNITAFIFIFLMVVCEFFFPQPQLWLQMRGEIMIMVCKVYSLTHDMREARKCPGFLEFAGYICCPANCIFGPWMTYSEYISIMRKPWKLNAWWVIRCLICVLSAFFFLTVSNCWCSYFLDGDNALLVAYRQALTFRASHYFVCYLSELGMLLAGYNEDKLSSGQWRYRIVNPMKIEFPSSLVSVVVNWNIPMHTFLKKYVYKKALEYGRFKAIFFTFFVSSMLHGFNTQITMILLSLGFFSYVQLETQEKLSEDLNACLQTRACKHICLHRYKRGGFFVITFSLVSGVLTVLHLAYLGMLMDAIDNPNSTTIYEKWESLKFSSHLIIFVMYLYTLT